nr:ileal sodium/bile acid cotransporter-like [Lytechinus pictus]
MAFHDDKEAKHFMPNSSDVHDVTKSGWDLMTTPGATPSFNSGHHDDSHLMNHTMTNMTTATISALNESMAWNLKTTTTAVVDHMTTTTAMTAEENATGMIAEVMSMVYGMQNETISVLIPSTNPMAITMGELHYVRTITTIMMTVAFAMVNLAMGASIGKVELARQWRVPGAVLVGCLVQFLVFPVFAFAIVSMFKLPTPYVTGMLLVAICPGGAMADVVTFFIDGNISVCVSMVLISTVISMGYVPVMLLIISGGAVSASVAVSMWAIGVAIFIIAVPLAVGVLIRSCKESWAHVVTVLGITGGLLVYLANSLVHLIIHTQIFHAPCRVYIAVIIVVIIGFLLTLFIGYLFGQHPISRHTLATHAIFHNTSLTMIILSTVFFADPHWRQLIVVPSIYGPITGMFGIIYIIVYLTTSTVTSDGNQHPEAYQPINEEPQGNGEYMTLEDGDNNTNVRMGGFRLKMKDYEEVNGTVTAY